MAPDLLFSHQPYCFSLCSTVLVSLPSLGSHYPRKPLLSAQLILLLQSSLKDSFLGMSTDPVPQYKLTPKPSFVTVFTTLGLYCLSPNTRMQISRRQSVFLILFPLLLTDSFEYRRLPENDRKRKLYYLFPKNILFQSKFGNLSKDSDSVPLNSTAYFE
jgi:hypothetical protein